jgi:maleate isomerase
MALTATDDRPYGWRARVGFITPTPAHENNAYEFYLMAPEGVTMVMTSLGVVLGAGQATYNSAIERLEAATVEIMTRKPQSIIQAGVPIIATNGYGYEKEVLRLIHNVTDTPAATDLGSCVKAMQTLGIKRPAMLTPFLEPVHKALIDYVANDGIEVAVAGNVLGTVSGGEQRAYEVSTMSLGVAKSMAIDLFKSASNADGVWITGALMPAASVIESLEQELGVPVVASIQAMTWQGLRMAGVDDKIPGFGRLLREA